MNIKSPLIDLFFEFSNSILSRDFIIDYFVDAELVDKETAIHTKMIHPGKLFTEQGKIFVVTEAESKTAIRNVREIHLPADYKLDFYHRFSLQPGMIENHRESVIETTFGVFILNKIALVDPFGDIIPYVNGLWNIGKIENEIARLTVSGVIKPEQVYKYTNNVHHLGCLNDFCVPALSEKCITSNAVVSAKRDELFEKYKDQLDDPKIMLLIEDTCIALDRELMKGDVSTGFLISDKAYDVQRKRMFIMLGLMESFGDDVQTFDFGKTNLNDGWNKDEIPLIANDIRRGSYGRAISTRDSGAEAKMLNRNFQDSKIIDDDCGTKQGIITDITDSNKSAYLYRHIVERNKLILLTENTIDQYVGKQVTMRCARYCKSKDGYCYTCMDYRFKSMGIELVNSQPSAISSVLTSMSLKKMHGSKIATFQIDSLNEALF